MQSELRKLPSVNNLLQTDQLVQLAETHGHDLVVEAIRIELDTARRQGLAGVVGQFAIEAKKDNRVWLADR